MGIKEATLPFKEFIMSDFANVVRKKEKSQGFAAFGIPVGAILTYKKDPAIAVKTLDDKNKVEYQGKPYSISTLAKQLVGSPVSGYLYFQFDGKVLKSLGKREVAKSSEPEEAREPVLAEKAAESGGIPVEPEDCASSDPAAAIDPLDGGVEADIAGEI
jgi:hypothetical protein